MRDYNPKRTIADAAELIADDLLRLALSAEYKGSPQHKLHPGDYGLSPPVNPRPGKTLCDGKTSITLDEAELLLRSGFQKGMVSRQRRNNWPQNIWAVDDAGEPYEAQLENRELGHYHGYPMPADDDFRKVVLEEWSNR